jgi:hypothetical protein
MKSPMELLPLPAQKGVAVLGACLALGSFAGKAEAGYNPDLERFSPAVGSPTLAMVSVNFDGEHQLPFGNDIVEEQTFDEPGSVADYYDQASFGQLTLQGEVFGPVTVSPDVMDSSCSDDSLAEVGKLASQAAEEQTGRDLSDFTYYGFTLPRAAATRDCNFGGLTLGNGFVDLETRARFSLTPHMFYKGVVVHELGHEEGLSHAEEMRCYDDEHQLALFSIERLMDSKCRQIDYGDPVDPMGWGQVRTGTPPDMSAINKARLGWLQPGNIRTMTGDGTAFIRPLEEQTTGTQLVRVPDGYNVNLTPHYYYLDFRQPVGLDSSIPATSPLVNGIAIREAGSLKAADPSIETFTDFTEFVDTRPRTPSPKDGTLQAGRTFEDPSAGIKIQTLSVSPEGAKVRIDFLDTHGK